MDEHPGDLVEQLRFWRALAEERHRVIQALHEFNYWHESTVARGEVIAGLEMSVSVWRERCLAAEANLPTVSVPVADTNRAPPSVIASTSPGVRILRRLRSVRG